MASINKEYLLTIAIPTYNRAKFLDRALHSIALQLQDKTLPIELIVSDNCSTDDTEKVVLTHINNGLVVRYIKNVENKGADFNIAQCYLEAKGKYVVAFGDDDIFLNGSLDQILKVLAMNEYGVVFLKSKNLTDSNLGEVLSRQSTFLELEAIAFINKVNYYLTFISGNIVNTKFLNKEKFVEHANSNLVQLPFILDSILGSGVNGYFQDPIIAVQQDNSGGYHLFKVFGENMYSILKMYDKQVQKVMGNRLLLEFFPYWILYLKGQKSNFSSEDPLVSLKKIFGDYLYFKVFVYPLVKLPLYLAKPFYKLIRVYDKLIYS